MTTYASHAEPSSAITALALPALSYALSMVVSAGGCVDPEPRITQSSGEAPVMETN